MKKHCLKAKSGFDPFSQSALPAQLGAARELLQENIAAERKIISNYTKRIDQASEFGDKGLAIRLENMLSAETDHLEELERLGR